MCGLKCLICTEILDWLAGWLFCVSHFQVMNQENCEHAMPQSQRGARIRNRVGVGGNGQQSMRLKRTYLKVVYSQS